MMMIIILIFIIITIVAIIIIIIMFINCQLNIDFDLISKLYLLLLYFFILPKGVLSCKCCHLVAENASYFAFACENVLRRKHNR